MTPFFILSINNPNEIENQMKSLFQRIWKRLKTFSFREWILVGLVAVISVAFIQNCTSNRTKIITVTEQSEIYKNKADEEYNAKTILLQEVKELKKSNDSLYQEYLKVKDTKPLVITKTLTEVRIDTLEIPTVIEHPSMDRYEFKWSYSEQYDSNNYFGLRGTTAVDSSMTDAKTVLEDMRIGSDLILDVVEGNSSNSMRVVARSNNPRLKITNIEGALIEPDKNSLIKSCFPQKRWGLGVSVGVGTGMDISSRKIVFGPQVTVGISYNILTW